jgi:hypothetical protein
VGIKDNAKMKHDKTTPLGTKVKLMNYLVAKMSKTMGRAIEKLDRASFLLYEIKTDLDETAAILQEIKQRPAKKGAA